MFLLGLAVAAGQKEASTTDRGSFNGASDRALAFDRASVRTLDKDGRLHVELSNISKATVSPYVGKEVPRWRELGLDPDRVYQFLRDAGELEKAAPTFNNLPLLSEHVPVSAQNHQPDLVVGSTGTDAVFKSPYLKNSLVIWAQPAIDGIESEKQRELSSAYYWTADMTPGVFEGKKYDGVMRDIIGNHVALVEDGRAGPDVVVGDSNEAVKMKIKLSRKASVAQGALLAYLSPMLAMDHKIDVAPLLAKVTNKNFKASRAAIVAGVAKLTTGKLAQDGSLDLDAVAQVLEALEGVETAEDEGGPGGVCGEQDTPSGQENDGSDTTGGPCQDADPLAKIKEFLAGKISPEDLAQLDSMMATDGDEPPDPAKVAEKVGEKVKTALDGESEEEKAAREAKEKADMDKSKIDRPAMDAAIKSALALNTQAVTAAVTKAQRELREAEKVVFSRVGELIAQDSAEAVYRAAAIALKIPGAETVHASALRTLIEMTPVPGQHRDGNGGMAHDSRPVQTADAEAEFAKSFPNAGKIIHV